MSSDNVNFPPVPAYPPDNMGDYLTPAQLSALTGVALSSLYANLPTLQAQRARLQEGFMAGIFTAVEFHERAASIDDKIKAIEEGRAQVEKAQDRRKNFLAALGGLSSMAARIPEWLATEDPPVVNTTLRTVLAGIVWHADRGTVTLRWDDK